MIYIKLYFDRQSTRYDSFVRFAACFSADRNFRTAAVPVSVVVFGARAQLN